MFGSDDGSLKPGASLCLETHLLTKTRSPSSALLPCVGWESSPTKIDCRKTGTLVLTSLLEELEE